MLITVAPAAKILETSEGTVRKLAQRGELPYTVTESGIRLFQRDAVERLAVQRKARRDALRDMK